MEVVDDEEEEVDDDEEPLLPLELLLPLLDLEQRSFFPRLLLLLVVLDSLDLPRLDDLLDGQLGSVGLSVGFDVGKYVGTSVSGSMSTPAGLSVGEKDGE